MALRGGERRRERENAIASFSLFQNAKVKGNVLFPRFHFNRTPLSIASRSPALSRASNARRAPSGPAGCKIPCAHTSWDAN